MAEFVLPVVQSELHVLVANNVAKYPGAVGGWIGKIT
jgi:hypothetical protein